MTYKKIIFLSFLLNCNYLLSEELTPEQREENIQNYINAYGGNYDIDKIKTDAANYGVSNDEIAKAILNAAFSQKSNVSPETEKTIPDEKKINSSGNLNASEDISKSDSSSGTSNLTSGESSSVIAKDTDKEKSKNEPILKSDSLQKEQETRKEMIRNYIAAYNGNFSPENIIRIKNDALLYGVKSGEIDSVFNLPKGTIQAAFDSVSSDLTKPGSVNPYTATQTSPEAIWIEARKIVKGDCSAYITCLGGWQPEGSKFYGDNPMPLDYSKQLPVIKDNTDKAVNAAMNAVISQLKANGYNNPETSGSYIFNTLRGYYDGTPEQKSAAIQTAAGYFQNNTIPGAKGSETSDYGYHALYIESFGSANTTPPTFNTKFDPEWQRPTLYDMINSNFGWNGLGPNYADPKNRTAELNKKLTDDEIRAFQNGNVSPNQYAKFGAGGTDGGANGSSSSSTVANAPSSNSIAVALGNSGSATPASTPSDLSSCKFNLVADASQYSPSASLSIDKSQLVQEESTLSEQCKEVAKGDASGINSTKLISTWSGAISKILNLQSNTIFAQLANNVKIATTKSEAIKAAVAQAYATVVDSSVKSEDFSKKSGSYSNLNSNLNNMMTGSGAISADSKKGQNGKEKSDVSQFSKMKEAVSNQDNNVNKKINTNEIIKHGILYSKIKSMNGLFKNNFNVGSNSTSNFASIGSRMSGQDKRSDNKIKSSIKDFKNNNLLSPNKGNNDSKVVSTENKDSKNQLDEVEYSKTRSNLSNDNYGYEGNLKHGRSISSTSDGLLSSSDEAHLLSNLRKVSIKKKSSIGENQKYKIERLNKGSDSIFKQISKAYENQYDVLLETEEK